MVHLLAILATEWIVHWIGDYPCQNSVIAYNKRFALHASASKNLKAISFCCLHGCLYAIPFYLFYSLGWHLAVVLALTHIVIDYFGFGSLWARLYNWDWSDWRTNTPVAPFFVCLELDQGFHHCTNIAILSIPYWAEWAALRELLQ
jgi:hypothetical protein